MAATDAISRLKTVGQKQVASKTETKEPNFWVKAKTEPIKKQLGLEKFVHLEKPTGACSIKDSILGRGGGSTGSTSDKGSRGPGFDSCWELDFFLVSLSYQKCGGPTLLIFLHKMLSCAALGKNSLIRRF